MFERGSESRQRARMKSCGLCGKDIQVTFSSGPFLLAFGREEVLREDCESWLCSGW